MALQLPTSLGSAADSTSTVPLVQLPYPYYTSYKLVRAAERKGSSPAFRIVQAPSSTAAAVLPQPLHNVALHLTELVDPDHSKLSVHSNTPWTRARRCPSTNIHWASTSETPSVDQIWLIAYFLFTVRPDAEAVRLSFHGTGSEILVKDLATVLLTVDHPPPDPTRAAAEQGSFEGRGEWLLLRAAFWQGAGSPTGPRPIWLPSPSTHTGKAFSQYPIPPQLPTLTTRLPSADLSHEQRRVIHAAHPLRPSKPAPGSVVYSRYFPTLGEEFSMVALDVSNKEHLDLFHRWQNDPRVSAGWNESGSLDHHRRYLEEIAADAHQIAVLGRFDSTFFGYFEFYYAPEDHFGPHWSFDRRHNLVGNPTLRGPHRANAWWSSQIHFLFLDDPRTRNVVGEPKATNSTVLSYDFITGFSMEQFVELGHKRSALMRLPRDRFFQLDASGASIAGKVVGGTRVAISPKL